MAEHHQHPLTVPDALWELFQQKVKSLARRKGLSKAAVIRLAVLGADDETLARGLRIAEAAEAA